MGLQLKKNMMTLKVQGLEQQYKLTNGILFLFPCISSNLSYVLVVARNGKQWSSLCNTSQHVHITYLCMKWAGDGWWHTNFLVWNYTICLCFCLFLVIWILDVVINMLYLVYTLLFTIIFLMKYVYITKFASLH